MSRSTWRHSYWIGYYEPKEGQRPEHLPGFYVRAPDGTESTWVPNAADWCASDWVLSSSEGTEVPGVAEEMAR